MYINIVFKQNFPYGKLKKQAYGGKKMKKTISILVLFCLLFVTTVNATYNISLTAYAFGGLDYGLGAVGGTARICIDDVSLANNCTTMVAGGVNYTYEDGTHDYALCLFNNGYNPSTGNYLSDTTDNFTGTIINDSLWSSPDETDGIEVNQDNHIIINGTATGIDAEGYVYTDKLVNLSRDLSMNISYTLNSTGLPSGDEAGLFFGFFETVEEYLLGCEIYMDDVGGCFFNTINSTDGDGNEETTIDSGQIDIYWDASEKNLSCTIGSETSTITDQITANNYTLELDGWIDYRTSGFQASTPYVTYQGMGFGSGVDGGEVLICTGSYVNESVCVVPLIYNENITVTNANGITDYNLCLYSNATPDHRGILIANWTWTNNAQCEAEVPILRSDGGVQGTITANSTFSSVWTAQGATTDYGDGWTATNLTSNIAPFPPDLNYSAITSTLNTTFDNLNYVDSIASDDYSVIVMERTVMTDSTDCMASVTTLGRDITTVDLFQDYIWNSSGENLNYTHNMGAGLTLATGADDPAFFDYLSEDTPTDDECEAADNFQAAFAIFATLMGVLILAIIGTMVIKLFRKEDIEEIKTLGKSAIIIIGSAIIILMASAVVMAFVNAGLC